MRRRATAGNNWGSGGPWRGATCKRVSVLLINVKKHRFTQKSSDRIRARNAYSYLQEYLPHVAQSVVRSGWTDLVGLGRMTLSYPNMLADAMEQGTLMPKFICRTFSDCTTAPRNGLISGCYPLDKYYSAKPEFQKLKEIKRATGA